MRYPTRDPPVRCDDIKHTQVIVLNLPKLKYYNYSRSNAAVNKPYGCLSTPKHTHTHTHTLGVKPQRGRGHLMVLVFCTLDSACGLFLPLRGALSVVEELKWIFAGSVCWLTVTSWPWFTRSPRPRPAIISITRWFLRRVPCAAELITPSVLNNCCHPPALSFCLSLRFFSRSQFCKQKKVHTARPRCPRSWGRYNDLQQFPGGFLLT